MGLDISAGAKQKQAQKNQEYTIKSLVQGDEEKRESEQIEILDDKQEAFERR